MKRVFGIALACALVAAACGGGDATSEATSAPEASTVSPSVDSDATTSTAAATTTVGATTTVATVPPITINPLYPVVDGQPQFPNGTAADAYAWIVAEMASAETTVAEIEEHFAPSALAAASAESWAAQFDEARLQIGGKEFRMIDIVDATPLSIGGLVQGESGVRWLRMGVELTEPGRITSFSVVEHNGNLMYPDDQGKSYQDVLEAFAELGDHTGMLVASVEDGACSVIAGEGETDALATGSIFKHWVLAGLGDAIAERRVSPDDIVAFDPNLRVVAGSASKDVPDGTEITVAEMARMMMGLSDNSATDILHNLVGRAGIEDAVAASNHARPELLTPFLSVNEQFALFWNVTEDEAEVFAGDDEQAQRDFVETTLSSVLPAKPLARFNESIMIDGTWNASPMDICNVYAYMRGQQDAEALGVIDSALGSQAAQTRVRNRWDRVWYKGGSLLVNGAGGPETRVVTHSWFVESADRGGFVVVGMVNLDAGSAEQFLIQSLLARLLELVAEE